MTNQNLEKARLWAETWSDTTAPANTRAAIDTIQSLPDQWVDAEKLREIIEGKEGRPPVTALPELVRDLHNLLTPKLPTLADMTREEWKACQWMQARYSGSDYDHVIVRVWQGGAELLRKDDGLTFDAGHASITPLPGPKLEWPGGEPIEKHGNASLDPQENIDASFKYIKKTTPDHAVAKDVCNSEPNSSETPKSSLPCPEDVPDPHPGEAWLVNTREGEQREALKAGNSWYVKDGDDVEEWVKEALTPISRLVPESHTLPEGMRLAETKLPCAYGCCTAIPLCPQSK